MIKKIYSILPGIFLCLLFLYHTTKPLFHEGLFPTSDNISVVRIEEMKKELLKGQFPVRYTADLGKGYGYMLYNFYAPLPFYTGAILNILGDENNLVGALKRTYFIAFAIGTLSMFFLGRKLFGLWGGIVASAFYSFNPFLGFDTYLRGGFGEVWAISFIPAVFYFLVRYWENNNYSNLLFSSIAIAFLTLSHNLTSLIALGFLFLLTFILNNKNIRSFTPLFFGLGISAFFWLPAFFEKNLVWVWYMNKNITEYQSFFLKYEMLFLPKYIFKMDFINPWYALLPVLSIPILYFTKINKIPKIVIISYIISLLALFFALPVSNIVWKILQNVLSILQFPWRFLTIYTFFSALLIGFLVEKGKLKYFIGIAIIAISFLVSYPAFRPLKYEIVGKYKAEDPCGTTWGYEYFPTSVKICLKNYPNKKFDIYQGSGEINILNIQDRYYKLSVKSKTDSLLQMNEYYFPGWRASVNGKQTEILYQNPYGLITIPLKKGISNLEIKFTDTPVRQLANIISLGSLLILLSQFLFRKRSVNKPIFK